MLEPGGTSGTISYPLILQGRSWGPEGVEGLTPAPALLHQPTHWLLGIYRLTMDYDFTGIRWIDRQ